MVQTSYTICDPDHASDMTESLHLCSSSVLCTNRRMHTYTLYSVRMHVEAVYM